MNSGHTDSDHSHSPSIRRINVMENTETKKADDGLGDYKNADKGGAGQADEAKKDTMVIVDPTTVNSGKGDCCTRFKKFCCENKCLVAFVCILIFLVILFLGLYIDACMKSKAVQESMTPPTASPGVTSKTTSSPGPTGVTSKTTSSPGPTEPPVEMSVIQGTITTTDNYTAALADPASLAFKTFENSFSAAVINFYAENHKEYIGYYRDTFVSLIEPDRKQTVVEFEIQFTQLDNDDAIPDAHTVLLDQLNAGRLGPFWILDVGSLTKS